MLSLDTSYIYIACWSVRVTCMKQISDILSIPECVQSPAWIIQSSRQQLHSWVSWIIVAQVQLSQVWGIWLQSRSQWSTALLCDLTAGQPANTKQHMSHWQRKLLFFKYIWLLFVGSGFTWEFEVHIVDSRVLHTVASLLNPANCCYSCPALSV